MGVHMCNSPNYPDTDEYRDRNLYNVIFSYKYILISTVIIKRGKEIIVN